MQPGSLEPGYNTVFPLLVAGTGVPPGQEDLPQRWVPSRTLPFVSYG
jgi:hypothetical protein